MDGQVSYTHAREKQKYQHYQRYIFLISFRFVFVFGKFFTKKFLKTNYKWHNKKMIFKKKKTQEKPERLPENGIKQLAARRERWLNGWPFDCFLKPTRSLCKQAIKADEMT